MSFPEKDFHIIIGEGNEIVFIGIKDTRIEEEDINEFVEKTSKVKTKKVKKIFISLKNVNNNIRLIAKSNRLTFLGIEEVNRILSIYNRSLIPF